MITMPFALIYLDDDESPKLRLLHPTRLSRDLPYRGISSADLIACGLETTEDLLYHPVLSVAEDVPHVPMGVLKIRMGHRSLNQPVTFWEYFLEHNDPAACKNLYNKLLTIRLEHERQRPVSTGDGWRNIAESLS